METITYYIIIGIGLVITRIIIAVRSKKKRKIEFTFKNKKVGEIGFKMEDVE